ncbi:polyphenol oxidase family protein [Gardnerella vaginalis]|uniref:Polyphenol oxidase family protein n=1 Tax=Gardnerella vaginalis TaxID=2702 RepID=A0AAW6XZ44_GARVA|nr:polyphenol oxidase family protein [Gardnerella vaginalis]MDK7064143.1 polyphenol oxidase family protein [Gardnerella vaginalis]
MQETSVAGMPLAHEDAHGLPIPVTIPVPLGSRAHAVFTTRLGGISEGDFASLNLGGKAGDDAKAVFSNRCALQNTLKADLCLVSQVHGRNVFDADTIIHSWNTPYGFDATGFADSKVRIEADAQVSTACSLALGMFAADCLPVLLADSESGVIAAAHCGRKGLMAGVLDSTIEAMCEKGVERSNITAVLGPCICGDCYEVGEEIASDFERRYPQTATQTRFGGVGIDIAEAARIDLALAGVANVVDALPRVTAATQYLAEDEELSTVCDVDCEGGTLKSRLQALQNPMCTLENPLWYSHRRAGLAGKSHEGRLLALIVKDK